ncbi:hypothetical protein V2J09_013605 [Rumex salicifolius]
MIPAFIFLLAIIFRMEKLEIRKAISQVKFLGTIVSLAGIFIVSFYKGPSLLTSQTFAGSSHSLLSDQSKWSLGCLIIAMTCLLASIRVIFQAATVKEFQDEMTIVFFFSLFGTIQSAIVPFFLVANSSSWKMTRRVEIITVVYAVRKQLWSFVTQKAYENYMALTITILYNYVVTWCLRIKGPVYVAMFKPLSIAIAAVMEFLFLGETLYLGSVTGTIIIVAGFYAFMWAKTKENNTAVSEVCNLDSRGDSKMENTEALPFIAMILVAFVQIGLVTLSKAAMISGLNHYVLIVGKTLPISFPLLCRIFGLSLIGKCLFPICFYGGLNYSSITLGAAIENLCPIFTFLLAVSFRCHFNQVIMEKLDLSKLSDQIKALGTIIAVLGAFIITLYKGPVLLTPQDPSNSLTLLSEQSNWLLGCLLLITAFLLRSLWTILQADTAKSYPDEVAIVFFYTLFGTIQTAAASLFLVKGPIYTSLFSPLKVALAGVVGFVFLHDGIYLGRTTIIDQTGIHKLQNDMDYIASREIVGEQRKSIMENSSLVWNSLPFVGMIAAQFVLIGSVTLAKASLMSGLSQYVYIVYHQALATIILIPWLLCRRLSGKTLPLTFPLLCRFFGLALIGSCLSPILLCTGLNYTSVTVVSSIGNMNPIFTFLFAICLRMERLDFKKCTDQIKAFGILVAVLGAFVVTLYKGPTLLGTRDSVNSSQKLISEQPNWLLGCMLITVGFVLRAIWNIFQADTAKLYPDEVTIVFFSNLFGTIQTAIASFFLVKGLNAWNLDSKIEIIAVVFSVRKIPQTNLAVSLSVLISTIVTWCLRKKGPVFVSMFDPLNVALAAFTGFVFLTDGIYLGSVIGSTAIIVGLYAVLWGQSKTTSAMAKKIGGLESSFSTSQVTPLLQSSNK